MALSLRKALPRAIRPQIAGLVASLPLAAAVTAANPAQAAPACQAINASGLLSGPPTIPSPACTQTIGRGGTFEIDFSNVFASNPSDFAVSNTYSLQIANINTGTQNSLSFSNVELLISGAIGAQTFTDQSISIWQATGQTGQGFSNFSTNGAGQNFGVGTAFKSANFTLTAPQALSTFGTAGVINTIALNLSSVGVTSFTGAKIRGTFQGATDASANPDFSAGLAIFTSNNPATQAPNIIYGNAFNAEVPGPLSIVGAGAAFGWSRRLRKRVRKSSTASVV